MILVGLRLGDGGYRDRNWAYSRSRWEATLPDWPIVEGHYDDPGPFSLARASNRAAKAAGDWDVAFYVGADFVLADPSQAVRAVRMARETDKFAFAHDVLTQLSESETDWLIRNGPLAEPRSGEKRHANTFSGALAVSRVLWDGVGGFDPRFVDWGFEDLAFWHSCVAVGGGYCRVPGDAFHLWHPRSWEQNEGNPHHAANQVLWERYRAARYSLEATRALIAERS